ncbi:putative micrococcal nuclease [Helianthus anomalus]
MGLLAANKGKPLEVIVEQVRDGNSLRVFMRPEFQFVQVFVAGIQVGSSLPYKFLYSLSKSFFIGALLLTLVCNLIIIFLSGNINWKKNNTRIYNSI